MMGRDTPEARLAEVLCLAQAARDAMRAAEAHADGDGQRELLATMRAEAEAAVCHLEAALGADPADGLTTDDALRRLLQAEAGEFGDWGMLGALSGPDAEAARERLAAGDPLTPRRPFWSARERAARAAGTGPPHAQGERR